MPVQVKQPRGRSAYQITSVGPYSGSRRVHRKRRRWPWVVGGLVLLVLAALAAGRFAWPSGGIGTDPDALARISTPSFGDGVRVTAHTPSFHLPSS